MRAKKVAINGVWGLAYKFICILLGFVGRTFFIKFLSSDYLGISGLFTNVLTILSLSELGFSSAISFHLYKHLATDNKDEIAGIMNFYKMFYRIVASFIGVVGLVVIPFLKFIVKDSAFSLDYITVIYIIYLVKTVLSYLFAYNFTLATADQKTYILTQVDIVMHIVMSLANIASLILFHNFIIYLIGEILLIFISNILKTRRVYKEYPYIKAKTKIKPHTRKKILGDVKNIFAGKLATVLLTSTDNILISAIVSVKAVGLYSNYSMIIVYIKQFLTQFTSATQASLGNMIASESKEYSYSILKKLTVIIYFAVSFCTVSLMCLLNPFITVWLGKEYLLGLWTVVLVVFDFYIEIIKTPLWFSVGGIGHFKEDRNIAIYGAVSNLVVSIIAAKYMGLAGIFFGTTFSQVTQMFFKCRLFISKYLGIKMREYLGILGGLTALTVVMSGGLYLGFELMNITNPWTDLIVRAIACAVVPNVLNLILFRKSEAFSYLISLLKRLILKGNRQKV